MKILPKALAGSIKKYLPSLISSNQTAYVEERFITAWKVSKYGVISGPYLDTFHAVYQIKDNKNIKTINIFSNVFLYCAYVDDTTFFVRDEEFVIEVVSAFDKFSLLSGLKPIKPNIKQLELMP